MHIENNDYDDESEFDKPAKTLRELVDQAQSDLSTYKHPNVEEAQMRLDEVLMAGKLGGIKHDRLVSISEHKGIIEIVTSYSVRSCEQTGRFKLPSFVVDAEDPMAAVRTWSLKEKVEEAKKTLAGRQRELARAETELKEAEAALLQLTGPNSNDS